ncbi:MAG: hypothetical protein ABSE35_16865 [Bryobacteraceae bacterium]|jgi:hypothetical protein
MVGFGVALAVSALLDFAIFVGGVFVLVAWAKVFSVKPHSKIPAALWALTAAVCLYPAMFVIGWVIPYDLKDDEILRQFAGALFSIASFGLVISSMVLLRRDFAPTGGVAVPGSAALKRILMAGSVILLAIHVLGFFLIFLWRAGALGPP